MAVIIILLKDIVVDPENPIDLRTLPEADAIEAVRSCYGFLSRSIEVSLQGDTAVIKTKEERAGQTQKVKTIFQRGVKDGQQGSYRKAIASFAG
jgi:hypothetical protein